MFTLQDFYDIMRDLQKLKSKAIREGIPYQTLASSILHRYTNE